jgi:hypothetical protein
MKQLQLFDMFNKKRKPENGAKISSSIDTTNTKKARTPELKHTPNEVIELESNDTPETMMMSFDSPTTPVVIEKAEILSTMTQEAADLVDFTFQLGTDKYTADCVKISEDSKLPTTWLERFQRGVDSKKMTSDSATAVIGVDCEWCPPWFRDNGPEKVCTIQIYCPIAGALVLSTVGLTKLPSPFEELFADERIIKVGVNISGDGSRIARDFGCPVNGMLDVAKGRGKASLEDLCKKHCPERFHIAKDSVESQVRLGNWSAWPLTELQIKYASMDAVVSYLIFLYQNSGSWETRLQHKLPKLSTLKVDNAAPKDPQEGDESGLERNESTSSVSSQHSNFFMMQQNRSIVPPKRGVKEYPQGSATCLSKVVVVVSGVLDSMSRTEFSDYVIKHGGKVAKSITKTTTHLVNDHGSIGPAKLKTCEAQKIPVVGEDAILELVKASLQ